MQKPKIVGKGARLQSGIVHTRINEDEFPSANGLLLKGVVVATYVTDDPGHPKFLDLKSQPKAVYCDVVTYSTIPRQKWFFLEKVLVSQRRGGLHDDGIWKPKAATMNVVTQVLNDTIGANPGQLDGDHVLVGFMNNTFDEPVIIRGIPHPSRDVGNENYSAGKSLKLKLVDGIQNAPDYVKHQGVFHGVDELGNHVVDSTFGHVGQLLPFGIEPPPDVLGISGNQTRNLPQNSTHEVIFWNMASPLTPVEVAKFKCTKDEFEILINMLPTLKVDGSAATANLTLGTGGVSAAIAESMAILWANLASWLALHTHPDPVSGFTGVPVQAATIPPWDSAIASGRLTFPPG